MSSISGNQQPTLRGYDFSDMTEKDIRELYNRILAQGMHGLCFSAYQEGQSPGIILPESQIQRRVDIMKPYMKWTRSFSCTEGHEHIPRAAKKLGIKTMVGAELGKDKDKNEKEIQGLITLAKEGNVDIAAVGNEVLLREDLTVDEIIDHIRYVKEAIPKHIPVSYVDAYFKFTVYPKLTDACDILLINCYPFWEGCHIDYSLPYMKNMYYQALAAAKGKKVIISETGWPSQGTNFKDSHPNGINFMKYFINAQMWSKKDNIEMMYFTSFDESWKVAAEGDVGAYWGIWDKYEKLKF
ncbi:glycosyl hydrolase family 17 protein [Sungkyunkwania multivorans]|uniref:Endo-1,3-beta-glucanase btgC n=1 Tax=Sungkyunkwania multivorans TaxID=1173618 RepID=A0ABW3D0A2_9FLAO